MPAIITHDSFGRDLYHELYEFIGSGKDELDAFLLGNQGPDPLFFAFLNPRLQRVMMLGSQMHHQRPTEIIVALKQACERLPEQERGIGRAYCLGFICHYLLDSTVHPYIKSLEAAYCDAGVPGLDRSQAKDVHALIESELDELVLTVKRSATIATFNPSKEILCASDYVLTVLSQLYVYVAESVFGQAIPLDTFFWSVKQYRAVMSFFYSPSGLKRNLIGRMEMLVRPHSFYRAMGHRNIKLYESDFDNRDHEIWVNPFTGKESRQSFFDLYDEALQRAQTLLPLFDEGGFDAVKAQQITGDLNFIGELAVATIVSIESAE